MDFSFASYERTLKKFITGGYQGVSFFSDICANNQLILRHDIDIDIYNCCSMAKIENELGLYSTFFFQPNNDYYNPLSSVCIKILTELSKQNDIGLHIDPLLFHDMDELNESVENIYKFYSNYLDIKKVFSFHRPAKYISDSAMPIKGFINAYDPCFMDSMKYVSDSNRREFLDQDVIWKALENKDSIMMLTHPIWWSNKNRQPNDIAKYLSEQAAQMSDMALRNNITLFNNDLKGK